LSRAHSSDFGPKTRAGSTFKPVLPDSWPLEDEGVGGSGLFSLCGLRAGRSEIVHERGSAWCWAYPSPEWTHCTVPRHVRRQRRSTPLYFSVGHGRRESEGDSGQAFSHPHIWHTQLANSSLLSQTHRPDVLRICKGGAPSGSSSGSGGGDRLLSSKNFFAMDFAFSRTAPERGCCCLCSSSLRILFSSRSPWTSSGKIQEHQLIPVPPLSFSLYTVSLTAQPSEVPCTATGGGGDTDTHDFVTDTLPPSFETVSLTCHCPRIIL